MILKNRIKSILEACNSLNNRNKNVFFILTLFCLKLTLIILINVIGWQDEFALYSLIGDDTQYIGYSENLFKTGEYYFKFSAVSEKDFTFRMPGITFIYLPLRFFFSQFWTLNLIVIFQAFFSTYSFFLLFKYFKNLLSLKFSLLCLLFSSFYLYSAYIDASLLTESLAVSSLSLTVVYLFKLKKTFLKKDALVAGLFFTWLVFLRPYMVAFLLVYIIYIWINLRKVKYILIFILPFILVDSIWFLRNEINHDKPVFLQTSDSWFKGVNKSLKAKVYFIKSFGFKWSFFEENTHAAWFNNKNESPSVKIPENSIFPERTFLGGMTIDSLIKARDLMHQVVNKKLDVQERINADIESARILNKFVYNLKKDNPFDYYLFNRVRLIFSFLSPNPPKKIIHTFYPVNVILTFSEVFFSLLVKVLGSLGLMFILVKSIKNTDVLFLILSIPLYILLLFPIYYQTDETRFFYLAYPFLLLGLFYFSTVFRRFFLFLLLIIFIILSFLITYPIFYSI